MKNNQLTVIAATGALAIGVVGSNALADGDDFPGGLDPVKVVQDDQRDDRRDDDRRGDSPNDQAAFAFFHASIGVANVARYLPQLAPPPRFVTTASHGHGFAEAIAVLLEAR